jgi:hypothetical protein
MKAGETGRESALAEFCSAVRAFSDEPCRSNLTRYLTASRALERPAVPKRRVARQTIGRLQAAA